MRPPLAALLLLLAATCSAKLSTVHIKTKENWVFVDQFCFYRNGILEVTVEGVVSPVGDTNNGDVQLSLYNSDSDTSYYWPKVSHSGASCQTKVNDSKKPNGTNTDMRLGNNTKTTIDFTDDWPLYWWLVVSDCNLAAGAELEVKLFVNWTNSQNSWYLQFPFEDQNLLTFYVVFVCLWLLVLPCYIGGAVLQRRNMNIPMILFLVSVVFYMLALFTFLIYYSVYASNGSGVPSFQVFGALFQLAATLTFVFSLLWFARQVDSSTVLASLAIFLGIVVALYTLYVAFFIWNIVELATDLQSTDYQWDTVPGILMQVVRCFMWIFFIVLIGLRIARNENPMFRLHTAILGLMGSLWFLYLPFFATVAAGIATYDRQKTILFINLAFDFIIYGFFALLMAPIKFVKSFKIAKFSAPNVDDMSEETPFGTL